ncbi:MAG TPA: muconolactone Delta-isomerase family protein [Edaphobacter sp.]|nr:muconolactone Delta-isomerase family protein [Edaphobacter sp.]
MQFFVLTRRKTDQFPADKWTPELLEQESQRVRELYSTGVLRSIWRRKDEPGAVLLLEAASEAEARDAASSLPLARLGMLELVALTPLEPYPGFGPR